MKLSKEDLKKLIVKEMKNIIDEETLIDPSSITYVGTGTISTNHDVHHDKKHYKSSSYMAKPQLEKIAEYAQKLHDMIPDGHELDDWQRSHLSSIADDISEVYHSLSYKMYKGEI